MEVAVLPKLIRVLHLKEMGTFELDLLQAANSDRVFGSCKTCRMNPYGLNFSVFGSAKDLRDS